MSELQIKRRIATGEVPAVTSLKEGELIVNPTDASLWVGLAGAALQDAVSLTPSASVKTDPFTVSVLDGADHHYKVAAVADGGAAAIVVTIPDTLPVGHRFQVSCQADTTFV